MWFFKRRNRNLVQTTAYLTECHIVRRVSPWDTVVYFDFALSGVSASTLPLSSLAHSHCPFCIAGVHNRAFLAKLFVRFVLKLASTSKRFRCKAIEICNSGVLSTVRVGGVLWLIAQRNCSPLEQKPCTAVRISLSLYLYLKMQLFMDPVSCLSSTNGIATPLKPGYI